MVQEETYKWVQARLREIDSGALSEKDLARLQEIAKSDPFVADALDGFHAHPDADHADHFVAIEEKIKVQKRERRRWLVPNLAVTAIAACFLLLIAGYAVIMRMDNDPSETLFVFVEPDSLLTLDPSSDAIAMESSPAASEIPEEEFSAPPGAVIEQKRDEQSISASRKKAKSVEADISKDAQPKQNLKSNNALADAAPRQLKKETKDIAKVNLKSHHIKGSLVDAHTNEPLAFAPYLLGHTNKLTFTDANGYFEFDAPEENIVMNIKHAGYEERTITILANNEAVQLDLTPQKESPPSASETSENKAKYAAAYFAFRDYISISSFIPLGTGITSKGKKVTIEFTVNQNGRPKEIKVSESTGDKEHVKEALRLISSGPDWDCTGGEGICKRSYTFYFQ